MSENTKTPRTLRRRPTPSFEVLSRRLTNANSNNDLAPLNTVASLASIPETASRTIDGDGEGDGEDGGEATVRFSQSREQNGNQNQDQDQNQNRSGDVGERGEQGQNANENQSRNGIANANALALPPTSSPHKRWWVVVVFRIAVLTMNLFALGFHPLLVEGISDAADAGNALDTTASREAAEGTWTGAGSGVYWIQIVYGAVAMVVAALADQRKIRVGLLSAVSVLAGLCAMAVAFIDASRNPSLLVSVEVGIGAARAAAEVLSVSIVSDMLPWAEVFVGVSAVLGLSRYLGYAVYGGIGGLLLERTREGTCGVLGIAGTGVAVGLFIPLVVRDPVRQASLLGMRASRTGDTVQRRGRRPEEEEKDEETNTANTNAGRQTPHNDNPWKSLKTALKLKSLWLITLSLSLKRIPTSLILAYLPRLLPSFYPSTPSVLSTFATIVTSTGCASFILGGLTTSIVLRLRPHWPTTPLWIAVVGSALSIPLFIFSVVAYHMTVPEFGVVVWKVTFAVGFLLGELGVGVVEALIVAALPPGYKTFTLGICAFVQRTICASVVEMVRLGVGLRKDRKADAKLELQVQALEICLVCVASLCSVVSVVGFAFAIRKLSYDYKTLDGVSEGSMSKARRSWFITGTVAIGVLVVVFVLLSVVYSR